MLFMQNDITLIDLPTLERVINFSPLRVSKNTALKEVIALLIKARHWDNGWEERKNQPQICSIIYQHHRGCALVVENLQIVGIFTEQDVVRLTANGNDLSGLSIADVMKKEVITLKQSEADNILAVLSLMRQHKVRHLPIVDNSNELVGIVTPETIRENLNPANLLKLRRVADVMKTTIISATSDTLLLGIAQLMMEHLVSSVVIVENDLPVGIITERDIVQFQALEVNFTGTEAREVMSTPLFCLRPSDLLWTAHQEMERCRVRRLVVMGDDGKLEGIVTQSSLLEVFDPMKMSGVITLLKNEVEERNKELKQINQQLQQEISYRYSLETALQRSQTKLNDILNSASVAISSFRVFSDRSLVYDYFSAGQEQVFGFSPRDFLANPTLWRSRVNESDLENMMESLFDDIFKESTVTKEYRFLAKDGKERWIADTFTSRRDIKSDCWVVTVVGIDITERKHREQELRESEERYRSVITAMQEGIVIQDAQTQILDSNKSAEIILGLTTDQMMGRTSLDPRWCAIHRDGSLFPGETHPSMKTLQTGKPTSNTIMGINKPSGDLTWISINSQPLFRDNKEIPVGVVTSFSDITERMEAEQKIREQAALLDVATDAIFVRSLDRQILYWNKGAERLYGWTEEEAIGQDVNQLLYKANNNQLEEALHRTMELGSWEGELQKFSKSGKEITIASRWTLVKGNTQKPKYILTVDTDITEKKQLEHQLLRTQRLESLGTLASGIAHDLNNILTPMLAVSQLLPLKLPFIDERSQEMLKMLETNAIRGADLVKQILSFARGTEGKRTAVHIKHLLLDIEQIIKGTFSKSIEINLEIQREIMPIIGDQTQLHQVLMNLAVNARDAMPNGGKLNIALKKLFIDENYARMNIEANQGHYIVIEVSDTGFGIPEKNIDRIYDPFFTTKEVGKGTGLGLSTVLGIVKHHGGFIEVFSTENVGTCFKVYLPTDEAIAPELCHDSQFPKGKGELVLVVDDEFAIAEITKTTLETHNWRVLTAKDGIEAIMIYAQQKNDIKAILIDMMMPSLDGGTAIQALQKINSQVQIIAMSGLASTESIARSSGNGVQAFLSKPFTAKELLETLYQVLYE
jgi:PAS domain S-box-containing protein